MYFFMYGVILPPTTKFKMFGVAPNVKGSPLSNDLKSLCLQKKKNSENRGNYLDHYPKCSWIKNTMNWYIWVQSVGHTGYTKLSAPSFG